MTFRSEAFTTHCTYPDCSCPFDAPADPNWCARGLPKSLEKISERHLRQDLYLFGLKGLLADPAILDHIPAVKALREECDRLKERELDQIAGIEGLNALIADLESANAKLNDQCVETAKAWSAKCVDLESQLAELEDKAKALQNDLNNMVHARKQAFGDKSIGEGVSALRKECERLNDRCMYWAGQFEAEQGKRIEASDRHKSEITVLKSQLAELRQCEADVHRLVRELDVIWNGESGAAQQASLCDMVAQIEKELRQSGEAVGEVVLESMGVGDAKVVRFHMYKEIPPVGTKLFTRPQPAIPPGYALVPVEPDKAALIGEFSFPIEHVCDQCPVEGDCEVCDGSGLYLEQKVVPWTTIKEIIAAHIASAPAIQPAIPPGYVVVPLIPTRAMEEVVNQDEWQWEDLLAAAEAITEDQYNEITSAPAIPPGYVVVKSGWIQMVVNALRRDADEGKVSRGEMVDALENAMLSAAPSVPVAEKE